MAEISEKYGRGYLHITVRQGFEIPWVHIDNFDGVVTELKSVELVMGACRPRVRVVTAYQGSRICPDGIGESDTLSRMLDEAKIIISRGVDGIMFGFSEEQIERYARHIILAEVGGKGQRRLLDSSVLLIGAGGLGCPAGYYLAAAGVGRLGVVDFDVVDASNLQRQILHNTSRIGKPKVESARETIAALNPDVKIETYQERLSSANIMEILADYDLVLDGCDNFPTRYLVNDATVMSGKTNVSAAVFQFEGQVTVFNPENGPCYRCLYPEPPPPGMVPSCQEAGVLGVLPGILGLIQATEAIKLILGIGKPLIGRLLLFDVLGTSFREVKLQKDPDCPLCGKNPTITELIDYEEFCNIRF